MDDLVERQTSEDLEAEPHLISRRAWRWMMACLYTLSLLGVEDSRHWRDPVTYLLLALPLASLVIFEVRRWYSGDESELESLEGEELLRAAKGLGGSARTAFLDERGYYASPACGQAIGTMASTMAYFAFYFGSLVWVDTHDRVRVVWGAVAMFGILAVLTAYKLVSVGVRRYRALSRATWQGTTRPPSARTSWPRGVTNGLRG